MSLSPGDRLGPYDVTGPLGAGGMGEVYRARDTRLHRDVALKVLPDAFAADLSRMARFEREAQTLAAFNHPHIAAIYGIEEGRVSGSAATEGDGVVRALVLELVEGDTLADRLSQGPIPVDEALPIARQICEALEAAHEHGVIHRDLKPANIKITPDGAVKILDFGLAKLSDDGPVKVGMFASGLATMAPAASAARSPHHDQEMTASPTKVSPALMTGVGVLLGTVAYMAPEQARGRAVDKRADIWAAGCVLFEMLAGTPPFGGDTPAEVLASVLKDAPPFERLPSTTPPDVIRLLHRCLEKDLRQRLRDIGEARIALERAETSSVEPAPPALTTGGASRVWRRAVGAALAGAVVAAVLVWNRTPAPAAPVRRLTVTLPPDQSFPAEANGGPVFSLAPDGQSLVYVAEQGDKRQLYLRPFDGFEAKPLPGTEAARAPFFSPDSQWVGFFADGKLKKVAVAGGAPISIADAEGGLQVGAWSAGDLIAFPAAAYALSTVPASGGTPRRLTGPDSKKGENNVCCPSFLPGSDAVLFSTSTGAGAVQIAVVSPSSGARTDLITGGSPVYAPTGHLLYVQDGAMMAVPFDSARLRITGPAVPVVDGVAQTLLQGVAHYSLSIDGVLGYIPGRRRGAGSRLVWVDRSGREQPIAAPPHAYRSPRLSPDGRRVAVGIDELGGQVWTYDLSRETLSRVTFGGEENGNPAWSPDGTRLAFSSAAPGSPGSVFVQPADGSGKADRLAMNEYRRVPNSWSADGRFLAFQENNPTTAADIWVMRMSDREATPFVQAPFAQSAARFSPDGHWLAYVSGESGRQEVYLQAYPGPGGKWQVSSDGGSEPVWNADGRELFFRQGNRMLAVELTTRPGLALGKPKVLFEGAYELSAASLPAYDVSRDGERFLMVKESEQVPAAQINLVLNWFGDLRRLVPGP